MRILLPEQAWIDYQPASFGSRAMAYLIDFAIRWTIILLLIYLILSLTPLMESLNIWGAVRSVAQNGGSHISSALLACIVLLFFLTEWAYAIYFEVRRDGLTPGKKLVGLRVVDERGFSISLASSFLRNAFMLIDLLPGVGAVGFISMLFTPRSQRIGDLVARTLVVYDFKGREDLIHKSAVATDALTLPLQHYRVLEAYLRRREQIHAAEKAELQQQLIRSITQAQPKALPPAQGSSPERLDQWLDELFKRAQPEKSQQYHRAQSSDPIKWRKLQYDLNLAEGEIRQLRRATGMLSSQTLHRIALAYQRLCQLYSELSTFFPDTQEALRAASLVRFGRRVIYGRRLVDREDRRQAPWIDRVRHGYREAWPFIMGAIGLMTISAGLTAALVILNPNLSWLILSEDAIQSLTEGKLWTEGIKGLNAVSSSRIMTNNIQVSILAFTLGIAGGFGTILVLVFNGASLGGIFAALSHYGMAHRLFNFVVAHGFLEMSIIAVAAGCGLALGDALLHPRDLTRVKSLQLRGRALFDLIIFSSMGLVVAGLVEGFVSPYEQLPTAVKLIFGLALGAAYWLTLLAPFAPRTAAGTLLASNQRSSSP